MKKADLRQQAEEKLSKRKKSSAIETDPLRLIQELEVHQIELEMQNEELMQARAEAEAIHRQYTDLYDFAPLGYFTLTRDGTIQMSNLTGADLLGLERNKLVKRRFGVFVSVESRPAFSAFLEKIFTTGKNEACEITLLKEGHESCWVHLDAVCSEDRLECRVVMNDITARRQAADVLRESEERFKAIANYTVSWESWFGPDGKYVWVNPGVEHFTGYSAQEILAMPDFISTVIADEDRTMFINRFQEAIRGNRGENFEFRYLHKNGDKRWLSASWQPIYDGQGYPLGTRSSGYDITERKQEKEALRVSEERYRLLANNVPDIIYSLDGAGNIVTVNSPAFERYGYTEQDSQGKPFLDFIHPEDREIVIGSFLKALEEQRKFTHGLQFRIVAENGLNYWFELNSQARFDSQGGYAGEDGVLRDITERKQAEIVMHESKELLV